MLLTVIDTIPVVAGGYSRISICEDHMNKNWIFKNSVIFIYLVCDRPAITNAAIDRQGSVFQMGDSFTITCSRGFAIGDNLAGRVATFYCIADGQFSSSQAGLPEALPECYKGKEVQSFLWFY